MRRVLVFGMTDTRGGIESFLLTLYKSIDREKVQFDFLCNNEAVAYEDELIAMGARIFKITARSKNPVLYKKQLNDFFKKHASDYCAVWVNLCSLANIDYLKLSKKYGIELRIIHSHNTQNMDGALRGLLHRWERLFIKSYATHFFACSKEAARWFFCPRIISSPRFRLIKNLIDAENFSFSPSSRDEIRRKLCLEGQFVVAHTGRLCRQKNQSFVLDIFKEITLQKPESRLLIIGKGEDLNKLEKKAQQLEISDKVLFLGECSDIPALLSAADAFVFPSLFEGLGISLLEAQASALPTFAARDNIPSEAKASDNFTFLSLKDSPKLWADELLKASLSPADRSKNPLLKGEWDISSAAIELEYFFISCDKKHFILTEIPQNKLNAGYKAKMDIRSVLKNRGYEPIDVSEAFSYKKVFALFSLIKKLKGLKRDSTLLLQAPIYSFLNPPLFRLFLRVLEKSSLKIICLVHDVESLRLSLNKEAFELEKRLFERCDRIIVHNKSMREHFISRFNIEDKKLIELLIFDYLCAEPSAPKSDSVCFAGNLSPKKSGFLYRLSDIALNLYGADFKGGDNLSYKGSFEPELLPQKLEGKFGLVWDGESERVPSGVFGDYLKYNNPHKASLYLAAGIPVIIWSQAALCDFIISHGAGLAVNSLCDLSGALSGISEDKYRQMKTNALELSQKLRAGHFTLAALKKAEEELSDEG